MNKIIILTILIALLLRVPNFYFPALTPDEARVGYRGYTLARDGRDELGRVFPLLFNSLQDYQLPLLSYITALGVFILGKSEFGIRIPYILIGVALVLLTYQIIKTITDKRAVWVAAALLVAFSPTMIFLSKFPNEPIVALFLLLLIFYIITRRNINIPILLITTVLCSLLIKGLWMVLTIYVFFILKVFRPDLSFKKEILLLVTSLLAPLVVFVIFLTAEQSERSLVENNLSLFTDITIKNGIDRLRGQSFESGWPAQAGRLLFNKVAYLNTGILHWLSNIQPSVYFGQFDSSGLLGYFRSGGFPKLAIIPFFAGLVFLLRSGVFKERFLLVFPLLLTIPALLVYPKLSLELTALTIPFIAMVIAFGLASIPKKFSGFILLVMILEVVFNVLFVETEVKNANILRPGWVKPISEKIHDLSLQEKVLVSDDIVTDITPYIQWFTSFKPADGFIAVDSPYKFRQTNLGNISVVGFDNHFVSCSALEGSVIIASERDLKRIQNVFNNTPINVYSDTGGENRAYLMSDKVCIK